MAQQQRWRARENDLPHRKRAVASKPPETLYEVAPHNNALAPRQLLSPKPLPGGTRTCADKRPRREKDDSEIKHADNKSSEVHAR